KAAQQRELARMRERLDRLTASGQAARRHDQPTDPVGYARDILGIDLIAQQQEIARALLEYPHRVLVRSANNVRKSALCGVMVNWFFDSFDRGICITTAPESRTVKDTCWKEVRVQRQRSGGAGLRGEKLPEIWDGPNHYARGYTIRSGEDTGFQGRHDL